MTAVPTAAKHPHGLERMLGNWCGSFLLFNIFTYFIRTYVYTEEQVNMNESQHIPSEYSETPPVGITGKWSLGKEEALFNFLWSCKISSLIFLLLKDFYNFLEPKCFIAFVGRFRRPGDFAILVLKFFKAMDGRL